MKRWIFFLFLLFSGWISAQELVLIKFHDKPAADTYFTNPTLMLSPKALDRREKYDIALNFRDVPVDQDYVEAVDDLGITPIAVSKWFNGVFAQCTDEEIAEAAALPMVDTVVSFVQNEETANLADRALFNEQDYFHSENAFLLDQNESYTATQLDQIKLSFLHNLGFTGQGVSIAVLDNGFSGVNTQDGFSYLRNHNAIQGGYNFVADNDNIYNVAGHHGTMVLSTMGGYIEGSYLGTAIDADYYLFITEDNSHELPDEEVHWISAAERADSLGVDVINTSLGYTTFDDPRYDLDYQDMDGQTSFISRAAEIAAEKGIMVVVAAGNEGGNSWHYISAPADAKDVLTVGAVTAEGSPAWFSSYGPTADGRIKPDVDALGQNAAVIDSDGTVKFFGGTSFSSPITAGAMACMIQAFPEVKPEDLRQAVRESADHYNQPTNQLGYGIPNYKQAYQTLEDFGVPSYTKPSAVVLYPNPTAGFLKIHAERPISRIVFYALNGARRTVLKPPFPVNIQALPTGLYFAKIFFKDGSSQMKKVLKK